MKPLVRSKAYATVGIVPTGGTRTDEVRRDWIKICASGGVLSESDPVDVPQLTPENSRRS